MDPKVVLGGSKPKERLNQGPSLAAFAGVLEVPRRMEPMRQNPEMLLLWGVVVHRPFSPCQIPVGVEGFRFRVLGLLEGTRQQLRSLRKSKDLRSKP